MQPMIQDRQPPGLKVFCPAIFFERYGFYIVQALLILYLVKFFRLSDSIAYSVLGSFIALSNIMPLVGGFIADKYWGLRRSIFIGAIVESLGFILLLLPGKLMLLAGLSILSMGVGLLKPSSSSLLGYLYEKNDPRQDSGYTIFYMVFNAGIILSTFVSGFLVRFIGWQFTFFTGVLSIVATYLIFHFGFLRYQLQNLGQDTKVTYKENIIASLITLATIGIGLIILMSESVAMIAFILVSISVVGIFIYCIAKSSNEYKSKLVAFFILLVISVIFWAIYMQLFLSMVLFIDNVVDKTLLGITIPASTFISIEALGVVIFGYPIARLWLALSKTKFNPSLPMKFCIGMIFLVISIAVLVICSQFKAVSLLINPIWILVSYLILGIAEVTLSPIGLSMVRTLVPAEFTGMMMGIFLLTTGLGGKIGGLLADFAKVPANLRSNIGAVESIYNHAFSIYLVIALVCTILALLLVPYIKKKIGAEIS